MISRELVRVLLLVAGGINYSQKIADTLNYQQSTAAQNLYKLVSLKLIKAGERQDKRRYKLNWPEFIKTWRNSLVELYPSRKQLILKTTADKELQEFLKKYVTVLGCDFVKLPKSQTVDDFGLEFGYKLAAEIRVYLNSDMVTDSKLDKKLKQFSEAIPITSGLVMEALRPK